MDHERVAEQLSEVRAKQQASRPTGTPHEVLYPLGMIGIPQHVAHWAKTAPDRPAVVFDGREITYAELDDAIAHAAGGLRDLGVRSGDRVGVYLPNSPQFIIAMMAILRLGAVHVPVNPMFKAAELTHELSDAGTGVVITLDTLLPTLDGVREQVPVRTVVVTGIGELGAAGATPAIPATGLDAVPWAQLIAADPADLPDADLDALAALNYTGGTTGLPKGCEHTQGHMLYTAASSAGAIRAQADGGFVALCYIPVFWIAGENLGILYPLVLGGTSVLMGRWDPQRVLDLIGEYGVRTMIGNVENYQELLEHRGLRDADLSSFDDPMAVSFVRRLGADIRHDWQAAVGDHSVLREGAYGMTETHTYDATPYGFADGDRDLLAEPVFCGVPVPGTDVLIVDFETGEPMPIGEVGEIIVRSPSVTTGYWRKPEATVEQLRDGWLHTGDNGRLDDDGCLHYLGRDKDMIKVKGMSVFPAEVEGILSRHEAVRAVAVVPALHPDRGQVPVAFVQLNDGAQATAADLTAWSRDSMATYKVPAVAIVEEFPMTATGKIRKVELLPAAGELIAESLAT